MSGSKLIFIIEDEPDVARTIENSLLSYGYEVESFRTGQAVLQRLQHRKPDICLVDLMLPDMDGLALVRNLGEMSAMGVMVLTGRGDLSDRVLGLEIGADDYLVKPFEPRELVARVKSLARRLEGIQTIAAPRQSREAQFGGWRFSLDTLTLNHEDGREDRLSVAEAQLLMSLLRSPNRVLSREQLMDDDMDDNQPFDRSIDVRISRLRKKLENDSRDPKLIKTIYGAGYLLAASVKWI